MHQVGVSLHDNIAMHGPQNIKRLCNYTYYASPQIKYSHLCYLLLKFRCYKNLMNYMNPQKIYMKNIYRLHFSFRPCTEDYCSLLLFIIYHPPQSPHRI